MPKKRNTSLSRSKKEKQIVTARLIELSLKVEDYIYKHKLISVGEAEQYIREVSSYKVQCSEDERSLQVIEKLTRCMRGIILDHRELRTENYNIHNGSSIPGSVVHSGPISPVYSIPDEDRTQFTQIAEGANNDIEIIDLSNIDDDDDSIHNGTNTATSDYAGSKVTVEVDIHKCMSILSLKDVGEHRDMAMSAEANCSQSILNNFDGVEKMQQNEINMTFQKTFAGGLVGNVTSKCKPIKVMQAISNNSSDKIPNKTTKSTIEPNKNVKTAISTNRPIVMCNTKNNLKFNTAVLNKEPLKVTNATSHIISSQIFCPATNNIPEDQRQTCYDSNSTSRINDSKLGLKDANYFTVVQAIRQVHNDVKQDTVINASNLNVDIPTNTLNSANKENQEKAIANHRAPQQNNRPISKKAVVQSNIIATKKKRAPRKKKLTNEKEIKPKNKRVFRKNPKSNEDNTVTDTTKNKILPIYNENVVNDLSWMENIRYVREIKVDENDPKFNFEESFWDNYYLPAGWSENEFV